MVARQILIPSSTNLYFNLWSACAFTTNSTRPLCSELEQSCAASSINITIYNSNTETSGNYPGWSYMKLPSSNQQFDVIAAIASELCYIQRELRV
jgi:hypothetical protein